MSFPLFDLAKDLAVARSGEGADSDSEPRILRRRIAGIAWAPGAILVVFLAAWSSSWLIGVAGIALLLVGLWLYAERADQLMVLARRSLRRIRTR
jgi:hypothetical protein